MKQNTDRKKNYKIQIVVLVFALAILALWATFVFYFTRFAFPHILATCFGLFGAGILHIAASFVVLIAVAGFAGFHFGRHVQGPSVKLFEDWITGEKDD